MLRKLVQQARGSFTSCSSTCQTQTPVASTSGRTAESSFHFLQGMLLSGLPGSLECMRTKYTYAFKKAAAVPGLVYWAPRTPGTRHRIDLDYKALGVYTGEPHKDLSAHVANTGGRNHNGRITCWGRGGGIKKVLRSVDYARSDMDGVPGFVQRIERDPNRTAFLALVRYEPPGQLPVHRYHIAPGDVKPGDILMSGLNAPIKAGSVMPISAIPLGVPIHNLELRPGKGGQMVRAANTSAVIQAKQEKYAIVKLPSGETRLMHLQCRATIGAVSNPLQKLTIMGKAGLNRLRGRRPKVRGSAMNPIDHPHGGRTNGGRPSCTPWGVYCKGQRTRRRNKWTSHYILLRKGGQPIDKFVNAKKWRAAARIAEKAAAAAGGGGKVTLDRDAMRKRVQTQQATKAHREATALDKGGKKVRPSAITASGSGSGAAPASGGTA